MTRWRDDGRERRGSADTAVKRRAADHFWALVWSMYCTVGVPEGICKRFRRNL